MLKAEEIEKNWKKHGTIIKTFLPEERVQKIFDMYKAFGDEIVMAPASSKKSHHNAFPGGYIDHVNRVVEYILRQMKLWKESGLTLKFNEEQAVFSALFHDLGKLGTPDSPNYKPQDDTWRKKNLGEMYFINPDNDFMLIQDRSLYLLQKFSIEVDIIEYLSIKTHDGLYDETNKPYYISYNPDSRFKTHLPQILHNADLLATRYEQEHYN